MIEMQGNGEPEEGHGTAGMSPHEIEELQKKNCVFCHIASGKVPARKVYEDNECVAVLDINPATPGHMLLMPKEHYTVMFQVPEQVLDHIFVIAKGLSQAGLKAFQSKGTTIFAANGVAAGQRAPHFMLHIIPRTAGDSVGLYIPSRAFPEKEAKQIAAALSTLLGGKTASAEQIGQHPIAHSAHRGIEPMRSGGFAASEQEEKAVAAEIVKEEMTETADKPKSAEKASKSADLDSLTEFLAKGGIKGGGK